jgi:hypothetical protein
MTWDLRADLEHCGPTSRPTFDAGPPEPNSRILGMLITLTE